MASEMQSSLDCSEFLAVIQITSISLLEDRCHVDLSFGKCGEMLHKCKNGASRIANQVQSARKRIFNSSEMLERSTRV